MCEDNGIPTLTIDGKAIADRHNKPSHWSVETTSEQDISLNTYAHGRYGICEDNGIPTLTIDGKAIADRQSSDAPLTQLNVTTSEENTNDALTLFAHRG